MQTVDEKLRVKYLIQFPGRAVVHVLIIQDANNSIKLLRNATLVWKNKIVQGTKRELCCFGRRMEELLGMCEQRTRAEDGRFSQVSTREHDQLYKQWYDWLRVERGQNLASSEDI